MRRNSTKLSSFFLIFLSTGGLLAGPKGEVFVKQANSPITIDGDFSDWPLASYTTISQQPVFPDGQGIGDPTSASGDHLVWDIDRIGPFNGTDPEIYEPDGPSDYGSSVYFAYDDSFLYVLGVFIDDSPFGARGPDGLSNFLNDGFEFFIDAKNDTNDLIAELGFPNIDEEEPNTDDFQFTMGLNDEFPPTPQGPNDLGVEVHMERAGDFEIIKEGYLEIREATDFSAIGGRDVAAKSYDDLRAAGATNPEIGANPDTTYSGYAVELAVPFGITDGFDPNQNPVMGFDLFWRDVDHLDGDPDLMEADPKPGFGGGNILWADWNHAQTVSGTDEDGNLFHGGNWGALIFEQGPPGDFDGDGTLGLGDVETLRAAIEAGSDNQAFDVNADQQVNNGDLTFFVTETLNSWIGDANLDGEFNSGDFVQVFTTGKFETVDPANWSEGDWNADGLFNSSDFVAAFADGGFEAGPKPAAQVPEPTGILLLTICCGAVIARLRRSR